MSRSGFQTVARLKLPAAGGSTRTQSKRSLIHLGMAKAAAHDAISALERAQGFAASREATDALYQALRQTRIGLAVINRRIARVEAGR